MEEIVEENIFDFALNTVINQTPLSLKPQAGPDGQLYIVLPPEVSSLKQLQVSITSRRNTEIHVQIMCNFRLVTVLDSSVNLHKVAPHSTLLMPNWKTAETDFDKKTSSWFVVSVFADAHRQKELQGIGIRLHTHAEAAQLGLVTDQEPTVQQQPVQVTIVSDPNGERQKLTTVTSGIDNVYDLKQDTIYGIKLTNPNSTAVTFALTVEDPSNSVHARQVFLIAAGQTILLTRLLNEAGQLTDPFRMGNTFQEITVCMYEHQTAATDGFLETTAYKVTDAEFESMVVYTKHRSMVKLNINTTR